MDDKESQINDFSGFMPMIDNINISPAHSMITTEGNLVRAHTFNLITKDGSNYVFSMDPVDLMRLAFLVFKIASDQ